MKRISLGILAHFVICFVAVSTLSATQKTFVMGGEKGWTNIQHSEGITTGKGRFGYDALQLETQTPAVDYRTAMLMTFDEGKICEETGRYKILENNLIPSENAVKGKGCALSRGMTKGAILQGVDKADSYAIGLIGSFTVEFWLQPSLVENGEKVFNYRTSINMMNSSEYQIISAVFKNNRLEWSCKNIFPSYKDREVVMKGYSPVIPGVWSRHTISFDEETGCLEYLVDGKTEDIRYITSTGHERGTVCNPVLGVHALFELCPQYTGRVDNIRFVYDDYKKDGASIFTSGNEAFKNEGGRFVTNPILVTQSAVLNQLDAIMSVPAQTDVKFFVRSGDNCYGWTDNYPVWKEVVPGEEIEGIQGLYFQVAAELRPDGMGEITPGVTQVTLKYTEAELPMPPFSVTAEPGDGQVTLSWSYSVDDNAGGYYVYYGNRPGEYLGRVAFEGPSPVRAGNTSSITLTGLQNGAIYYFAVSAYSRVDGRINGELSKEVFARPSKRLASIQ